MSLADTSPPEIGLAEIAAGASRGDPGFAAVVESLPDPVLVITARDALDLADRRIAFANLAARDLLRIQSEGMSLLALMVMRDETDSRRNERMRADFLANASHELRTPLASLTGFIETLRGHAKDDAVARERFLGVMAAQAGRMARLIDDLMSLSRIELNEHIAPEGRVDVTVSVLDVIDALTPIAADRGVRLSAKLPARGLAMVVGDRDQLLQVAQNLIDNGLKYSPNNGVLEIEVTTDVAADMAIASRMSGGVRLSLLSPDLAGGERFVVLRVTDHGPGVAREHLPRLSERFYRVQGQKSGERLGTGLGLAIVKHIINRHRGGLAIESVEGQGAIFTAYLPQPS